MKNLKAFCISLVSMTILGLGGCAADTESESPSAAQDAPATTKIYWSDVDKATNQIVVRSADITQGQVDWLMASRKAAAAKPAGTALQGASGDDVGKTAQAYTSGSTSWSDCASYEWFLVSSGNDGSGSLFCAKYSTTPGSSTPISLPFVPQWYDSATSSPAYFNLCTGTSNCAFYDCGLGGDIWNIYGSASGTANISPPASVLYIQAQYDRYPC